MSTTRDDVRYALRSLRRNPGFTSVAVASLALGIGVNTAIFSLVDQLLLWSVPARDPGQLVNLEGGRSGAYPFYREYRDRNQVFSGMLASSRPLTVGIRPEGAPAVEVGHVSFASGNYFQTLGVGAAAGRVLVDSDDTKPGGSPVVILAYDYWQRRFAGNLNVIGRRLAVNGYPLEIAGIAEKGFGGIFNGHRADAFIPLTAYPLTRPAAAPIWNTPSMHWLSTMARLRPGVSIEKAQADMRVLWPQVADAVNHALVRAGGKPRQYDGEEQLMVTSGAHGVSSGQAKATDPLEALMAAAGLVLLIACSNIANLTLARAAGRRKEIAPRLAMGATRARLVRQILTESLVLAVIGGAAGFVLAHWSIVAIARANLVSPDLRLQPSLALAAFSAVLTLLTSVLFGLAPALRITRVDLAQTTRDSGSSSQGRSRVRLGKVLIAGQAALSLALLVGAGLFIRTLRNLEAVDLGFQRENVVLIDADASSLGYKGHRLRTFYDQLLERTRHLPNVRSAGLAGMTPMGGYAMSRSFSAEGYQPHPGERLVAYSNPVTEGYFTALGIPLLLGRDFLPQDEPAVTPRDSLFAALGRMGGGGNDTAANASRVCIINESLARRLFGGANPVGRHLSFDDPYTTEAAIEIVGVVKDVRHGAVRYADEIGTIYVPSWSHGAEARYLAVRIAGKAAPTIAAIQRQLRDMDPNVPLLGSDRLEDNVSADFRHERMIAYLCGCFGALALTLSAVGLYGVMAYAVAQRTREVGIRMALGARRFDVIRMIVREALVPVLFGIAIGIVGALAANRVVASLLFGVAPRDPLSFVLAVSAMLGVALLAAAIPARRASRVEPAIALRYE
ncbi:MAG: ABC transporter permease [Bryobacteraceae bacterium]|jgi:predicted permease